MIKRDLSSVLAVIVAFCILLFLFSQCIIATETSAGAEVLKPNLVQVKPKIDGILDDEAWKNPPLKKEFISYKPVYGEKLPYETWVWVVNDSNNLYFAFLCFDPHPGKIQTSLTKRDNMFGDDWVGVAVDAAGSGQASYVLYVNPSGIQGDSLAIAGNSEDMAPDFVWESAAKITRRGYLVEICLPLKSIRYKSGKEVKMGLLFKRKVTYLGIKSSWPDIQVGHRVLDSQTTAIFRNLKKQLKLEILPNFTHSNNRQRVSPDEWGQAETATQFGIGIKYGLTSSITAEVTFNPDFSQVESDAFQVEVNQRYPLFFREKRPFFMEGADIFKFYTLSDGFFRIPVHTRRIVDPARGAKITGDQGNISFGFLWAGDQGPGLIEENKKNASWAVARGKYSLGQNNYIGLLYSGREFSGEYNRVLGADCVYRPGNNHLINASFLHSFSGNPQGRKGKAKNSSSVTLEYGYDTKQFSIGGAYEHIGTDFKMDSAYILRKGITNYLIYSGISFYPNSKKNSWLKMISPELICQYTHDLYTKKDDILFNAAIYVFTSKEGDFNLNYTAIKEYWQEKEFNLSRLQAVGVIRLNKWLKVGGEYSYGDQIYYEGDPAFKGKGSEGSFFVEIQPNIKFNQYFSFIHSDLSTANAANEKIYDVNILYSNTTYQFNKYFFLRAVIQYDSYDKLLLSDLLASFTLIPGTVVHLGYGGLYENRQWQNNRWIVGQGNMIQIKRSFYAKVSYLWRF